MNPFTQPTSLSFNQLRKANLFRLPKIKNAQCKLAHKSGTVDDWSLAQWSNAMCGEAGEAANLVKKIERGDFAAQEMDYALHELARELADVVVYADFLAARIGVDLGAVVKIKWDEVSERLNLQVKIDDFTP